MSNNPLSPELAELFAHVFETGYRLAVKECAEIADSGCQICDCIGSPQAAAMIMLSLLEPKK